jgi:hypothetical protein
MPTDFQLAEGGGMHYQTGVMPGLLGGGMSVTGGGGGGLLGSGVTYNPPTGFIPPGTGGGVGGNVMTDTSGSGGEGFGPGGGHAGYNEYGQSIDHNKNVIDQGVPWENTFLAPLGLRLGWNYAGGGGSSTWQDMGDAGDDEIDALMMDDANLGTSPSTQSQTSTGTSGYFW